MILTERKKSCNSFFIIPPWFNYGTLIRTGITCIVCATQLAGDLLSKNKYFDCMLKTLSYRNSWTLDAGFWTLDSGRWTLDFGLWTLGSGRWTVDPGPWTLDLACWTPDAGLWTLNARLRPLKLLNLKLSKNLETMDLYQ